MLYTQCYILHGIICYMTISLVLFTVEPEPYRCPVYHCMTSCDLGYQQDSNGCNTCTCGKCINYRKLSYFILIHFILLL